MNNPAHSRAQVAGFTLVEIMVSLAILSMVVLATLTAFRSFADTQTRLEQLTQRNEEMRLVGNFLRQTIGQALPLRLEAVPDGVSNSSHFHGEAHELLWVAPMLRGTSQRSGLHAMRLFLDPQRRLILQLQPYVGPNHLPEWDSHTPQVLLEHVDTFKLAYRTQDEPWEQEWDWQQDSPTHVMLELTVRERSWPRMVIALPTANSSLDSGDGFTLGGR